jgi:hypothetical protein
MYINTLGGSALLHLLVAYPRLVLIFGLAGTVAMTAAPHGPGRYAGTGAYMAQLDAAFKPRLADAATERQAQARVTEMLERSDGAEIHAAVEHTLDQCGPGCTDVATPIVIDDPELLRRVLVLYQLDHAAAEARALAPSTNAIATGASRR